MILTGKCKDDFKRYIIDLKDTNYNQFYYNFDDLTTSMKYGVYQDFFDKVGLEMVDFKWRNKYTASMYVGDNMKISKQIGKDKGFSKRDDARVFVVNQTNDYYNLNDYKYELESETKK